MCGICKEGSCLRRRLNVYPILASGETDFESLQEGDREKVHLDSQLSALPSTVGSYEGLQKQLVLGRYNLFSVSLTESNPMVQMLHMQSTHKIIRHACPKT